MSAFCQQCSTTIFNEDFEDLKGITTLEDWSHGKAATVLCEGCGPIQVDPNGRCISDCPQHHNQTTSDNQPGEPHKEKGMNWKPQTGQSIDALYAWVATEPDGGEGVIAAAINGMTMPLVGADMDRMKSLSGYAKSARTLTGYPVRLVRFSMREDLEILL